MPKILFVHHATQISGAENSLLDLLAALDAEWEPVVACPGGGPLAERLQKAGARVVDVPMTRFKRTLCPLALSRYFLAWRRGVRALAEVIREANIDIVHSNSTTAHLYGGAAARRCGVPSVWHVRDVAIPGLTRLLLPRASACIAISHFIAERVESSVGVTPEVIYNGVDLERFHPPERPPEEPTVAMVGQLVTWKGHHDFLQAAGKVRETLPAARFLIVGEDLFGDHPHYKKELEALAADLGIAESVTFTGYCADVPELLRTVSVLALPSREEPFGRILVEAMASGVPVVAYEEGGPTEIIAHGKTGLLVPRGDVAQLASAVAGLLLDPAKASRLGDAGRARAAEAFSHRRTAENIMAVYSRLLEGRE